MAEDTNKSVAKKPGRPKKAPVVNTEVNEQSVDRLQMEEDKVTIETLNNQWKKVYANLSESSHGVSGVVTTVMDKWNKLNPFLQNQRIKNLYTQAKAYGKADISEFLANPGNNERPLRSLSWANSSSQKIYYFCQLVTEL